MKKLTKEEVFEQLVDTTSAEIEGLGEETKVCYYLHVKEDGTIVDDYQKADATFVANTPYWRYADTLEQFQNMEDLFDDAHENMNWKPFKDVVEDLTSQANEWLEKGEEING